jgi:hypothetical protein
LNDCRELIPEFLCSLDFLPNRDHFNHGASSGTTLDDVIRPKWASSSHEFLSLNPKALESDYVSAHLGAQNTFMKEMYDDTWNGKQNADARTAAVTCHCGPIEMGISVAKSMNGR